MVNIKLVFETSSNEPKVKEGRLEEPRERLVTILAVHMFVSYVGELVLKSRLILLLSIHQ